MSETKIGMFVWLGFMLIVVTPAIVFHAPLILPSFGLFVSVPLLYVIETRRVYSWRQLGRVLVARPLPRAKVVR